jgi:isopenicillin N synthase-like dioxygenase
LLKVPLIDIAAYERGSPEDRRAVAEQVDRAAREVGFMQVVGHGIADSDIADLAGAIDGFFSLPLHEKQHLRPPSADVNRGYTGPMTERLSYSLGVESAADLFEAFNVGAAASELPALALPGVHYPENIWPGRPEAFRRAVGDWFRHAGQLARRMTAIFAAALGLPEHYFVPFETHSIDTLRLNHYAMPAGTAAVQPDQMGMGGHTDYGIVTVLWADAVRPGLQILDRDGRWHDVLPAPGALLINLGDLLARWTNDRWISTMHRVLPPVDASGRAVRRRSAAFFHDGNYDATISCLPGCVDQLHPACYAAVTVGEHLEAKLRGSRGLVLNASAEREAARIRGTGKA